MMHDLTGSALKSCLVHDRYRWQLRVPAHSERTAQRSGHAEQSRPADYGVPWTLRTRLNNQKEPCVTEDLKQHFLTKGSHSILWISPHTPRSCISRDLRGKDSCGYTLGKLNLFDIALLVLFFKCCFDLLIATLLQFILRPTYFLYFFSSIFLFLMNSPKAGSNYPKAGSSPHFGFTFRIARCF